MIVLKYSTEQEEFWAGSFGNDYVERNLDQQLLSTKTGNFAKFLRKTSGISNCLEVGCNIGLNLIALSRLIPNLHLQGIEINEKAANEARKIKNTEVFCGSVFDYPIEESKFDLAFTMGVLIHINPDKLNYVYDLLYKSSKKYIMVAEYYNPTPTEVTYRGNKGKLFKRDFAGEFMDKFGGAVKLLDYGFVYHRDQIFPLDDVSWFMMEKLK